MQQDPGGLMSSSPERFRFGDFELVVAARELRKNGERVRIQDKPLDLLRLLIERPGQVVSRETVRQTLWPADTFVDFDHSLGTALNKLRTALGDSARSPVFVETVANHGYKFIAPVSTDADEPPAAEEPAQPGEVAVPRVEPRPELWTSRAGALTAGLEISGSSRGSSSWVLIFTEKFAAAVAATVFMSPGCVYLDQTASPPSARIRSAVAVTNERLNARRGRSARD